MLILVYSPLYLICAFACADISTGATSLKHAKSSMCHFCLWHLLSGTLELKTIKEWTKTSNWIVDHFSLTFVNLVLAWVLYFYVWLQNKGKFKVWSEYYNQFAIYQMFFCISLTIMRKQLIQRHIQNPLKHLRWSVWINSWLFS